MVKLNHPATGRFWQLEVCVSGTSLLDIETRSLVQRWITAFCETPILIDADLMRQVLDDVEGPKDDRAQ